MTITLVVTPVRDGYVFGGQQVTIEVSWPTAVPTSAATLAWELGIGDVKLAGETVSFESDTATIKIELPPVSSRTELTWRCRVRAEDASPPLAEGETTLHVFPPVLTVELAKYVEQRRVALVNAEAALAARLAELGIPATKFDAPAALMRPADIIVLRLEGSPRDRRWWAAARARAERGAAVLVLGNASRERVLEYRVQPRPADKWLRWRTDHPILSGFSKADLASWVSGVNEPLRAVALPLDEPALEIACWSPDWQGDEPRPLDALLLEKRVGRGRVIVCQLSLDDWQTDPRAATVLVNTIQYLTTRPIPTPSPRARHDESAQRPDSTNEINLTPGARP